MKRILLFIGALFFILKADFFAQDKSLYELLKENFKKKYLSIGLQFQVLADFQPERNLAGNNGFRIANLKLKIKGGRFIAGGDFRLVVDKILLSSKVYISKT